MTTFSTYFYYLCNEAEARQLAQHLVKEKLAACVGILPTIESIYMWEGEVTQAIESKTVKTKSEKMNEVIQTIRNCIVMRCLKFRSLMWLQAI